MGNIVDLGNHDPSVESVISRLSRHQEDIKSITVIITWENGDRSVHYDTKPIENLSYDSFLLIKEINNWIEAE